ncbi:MAG: hypothetical protein HDKAJFGB_00528 [Anaerolineae bacterium]|nr:hypothetical protein [Anaerolineae bacterium]
MSLKQLGETHSITLHWRAFELRPVGAPPLPPEYRAQILANRPAFAARVQRDYGVAIQPGPFDVNTRALHQLKKFADAQGKGAEFHQAALEAYWLHEMDVSAAAIQQALLAQVGLTTSVAEVLADENYLRAVLADEQMAHANNINGVPALVFAEKYLVVGAQPLHILRQVVEQARAEQA